MRARRRNWGFKTPPDTNLLERGIAVWGLQHFFGPLVFHRTGQTMVSSGQETPGGVSC